VNKAEQVGAIVRKRTIVRSKEFNGFSMSRSHLWNLAKAGKIERVGRGLYRAKEAPISTHETLLEVAKRVPRGVLCLSSALRFHEMTTENPFEVWVAIERGAWSPKLDYPPIRVVHFSEAAFKFGIENHPVDGGTLRVYSPAKTVADCFKFRSKIGMETAIQALRGAYREKKTTMDQLWRAAKVCRVVNVMRPYMESLV
jgi:predicted transcriptional regulator of viral defense system